jgi:hypothetical protein
LDFVVGCLSLSIGCAVAWLLALYTPRGERMLIGDTFAGTAGAALCALAFWWIVPAYTVAGLLFLGPVFARVAVALADMLRRLLLGKHHLRG